MNYCNVLRNLVPFVQLKKGAKYPWRSVTLENCRLWACNFTKSNTPSRVFFTFFKLYKWCQIAQRITHLYAAGFIVSVYTGIFMRLKTIFGVQVVHYKIESLDLFFYSWQIKNLTLVLDDKHVIKALIIFEINPFHATSLFLSSWKYLKSAGQ